MSRRIVHVHVVCWNEAKLVPWICAHYSQFADRIFFHDNFSDDGSRELIGQCPIAEIVDYNTGGQVRDDLLRNLKNTCWKNRGADWVICCDADEFVYIPGNVQEALAGFEKQRIAIPECQWVEMAGDGIPDFQPGAQLYDLLTDGVIAPPTKSLMLNASAVRDIGYEWGAHRCSPVLIGEWSGPAATNTPVHVLHFKYARGIDSVLARHTVMAKRLSAFNQRRGLGHHWLDAHAARAAHAHFRSAARQLEILPQGRTPVIEGTP